jgi:hypothetical protein
VNKTNLVCALCLMVALAGCGRKAQEKRIEKAIEKETGGKAHVDLSEESINIKTEDGELNISGGKAAKIPDDFPSDIHVYKGAKVVSTVQAPDGMTVSLLSKDTPKNIADAYKTTMTAEGWTLETSMNMGAQQMLMFAKDDRAATVTIGQTDDGTMIGLILVKEQ